MTEETNNKKVETVKKNTPKKRGRKTKKKGYFMEEQERAFKEFLTCENNVKKEKIFKKEIYPALCKMVECLIHRYYLFVVDEAYDDTFNDTLSFLMTKINNFDPNKKCKAYSYCGTVCKNYLILRRVQSIKNMDKHLSYEVLFPTSEKDSRISNEATDTTFSDTLIKRTKQDIEEILRVGHTDKRDLTINEIKLGNALLEILEHWEIMINNSNSKKFNKASILYYIKEYTLCSTAEIRNAMKLYKNTYLFTKQDLIKEWF